MIVYSLALMLMLLPFRQMAHAQQSSKIVEETAKAKAEVAKRGTGDKARVTVRLRDGGEVKGYISQADQDKFTIINEKTSQRSDIAYSEVKKVKGRGGLSKGAKIGIFAAIGAGAIVTFLAVSIARVRLDPWPR
jgi:flagellar biosynthesis/type III secretory pathway ATPase